MFLVNDVEIVDAETHQGEPSGSLRRSKEVLNVSTKRREIAFPARIQGNTI